MITAQNLTVERIFKHNAVYLVSHGMEKAVLKAESLGLLGTSDSRERIDWVQKKGASPQVKKTLGIMGKLISYVTKDDTDLGGIKTFDKFETSVITTKIAAKEEITVDKLAGNVWYLMPVLDNFKPLPEVPRPVMTDLKFDPRCMRSLGHVLVCDAFMANTDRLGPLGRLEQPGYTEPGISNAGNIFLTWSRKQDGSAALRFLGIDFADTQLSPAWMFGVDWPTLENQMMQKKGPYAEIVLFNFNWLKKGQEKSRDAAALWAVLALSESIKSQLTQQHVKELREGMREGRARLESFYKKKINKADWPAGLESRFKACGW